jgi:hypothetical protein
MKGEKRAKATTPPAVRLAAQREKRGPEMISTLLGGGMGATRVASSSGTTYQLAAMAR